MGFSSSAIIYELIARDSASGTFARVGSSAELLAKKTGTLQSAIQGWAKATTVAMAAGAAISIKMASDFQASMTRVQTQAGASAKDVQELSKQVLELGKYAEQSPKQLADALFHLKSVGLDNVDAMKALKVSADLAAVGNSDLEETTNALAGAWRTGIKGAEDFGQTAATVNAIIGAGNMKMGDLVDAMGTGFLASAKTFGLSLTSVGAALALMTDEGVPASDAATRLRMSMSLLGAPSHEASKALGEIHLTGLQLADAMRSPGGLVSAIGLLKEHLDQSGLSASESAALLSKAFGGGRSSSAIMTLVNNFDVLKQKQDQINSSVGKFGNAVETQRATAEAQFKLLISSLQVTAIQIGNKLLPIANNIVHSFSDAFTWLTNLDGPTKTTLGLMASYLGIIAPLLFLVPKGIAAAKLAMVAWKVVMIAWTLVTDGATAAQVAFDAAVAGNPVGLIIEAIILVIVALGVAIYELVKHWDTVWGFIKSIALDVWHAIQTAISFAWESVIKPVFTAIETAWNAVSNAFVVAGKAIADAGIWVFDTILKPTFNVFMAIVNAVGAALSWLWNTIISPVFTFIGNAAIIMGKIVLGLVLIPIMAFWKGILQPALELLGFLFGKVWDGIGIVAKFVYDTVLKPTWDNILDVWHLIEAGALWLWHNVFEPVWNGIKDVVTFVWDIVLKPRLDAIVNFFTKTIPDAASWLWQHVTKIWNDISDNMSFVYDHVIVKIFNKFGDAIHVLGDVFSSVKDAIGIVWDGIKDAVAKPVRFVVNTVLDDGVIAGWNKVVDFLSLGFLHINPIPRLATGGVFRGVIPGYTPGRDTHMAMLGGGEAVMRPEWTRAAGHAYVNAANSASRSGGVTGAERFIADNGLPGMPQFFLGGVFDWLGSAWNGVVNLGGKVLDFVSNPVASMESMLNTVIDGADKGGIAKYGHIVDMAFGFPKKIIGGLVQKIRDWFNSSFGGGGAPAGAAPANISGVIALGQQMAAARGWTGDQWNALYQLWQHESGWNPNIRNKSSGAYGIPQALPPGKMGHPAVDGDAAAQIAWGMNDIGGRYGSPSGAWASWLSRSPHWYGAGLVDGVFNSPTLIGVGERGPERVNVTPLRGSRTAGSDGPLIGELHVHTGGSGSPDDVAYSVAFELRKLRRGGVHR